ncbi:MAG: hypothetical protein ACREFE_17165, partial [Limisphaerales bacterium]
TGSLRSPNPFHWGAEIENLGLLFSRKKFNFSAELTLKSFPRTIFIASNEKKSKCSSRTAASA